MLRPRRVQHENPRTKAEENPENLNSSKWKRNEKGEKLLKYPDDQKSLCYTVLLVLFLTQRDVSKLKSDSPETVPAPKCSRSSGLALEFGPVVCRS